MSGGFFRGTSADQDTRFSNKQAKLLKSQKFAPELDHLVDMTKVKMDVIRPWIANRVTELLGFEDEVLINFIYGLLEGKDVNGKEVQISLTGFMEKNTGKFMKELWSLLLSAQKNASGVPQQLLDAKGEEIRKKQAEQDHIASEIQRKKDKESRELEERSRKMDGGIESKAKGTDLEPTSKHMPQNSLSTHSEDEKEAGERNGVRGKSRGSGSLHSERSASLPRGSQSRSMSRSRSNSRSFSNGRYKSRSVSRSPEGWKHSISPKRRSMTPRRRRSSQVSLSPPRRKSSYSKRKSRSRSITRSPSPLRRRMRSPIRRRSPSPSFRRRSPLPIWRRRSPSPIRRRRSPSPIRRRRSPSPLRRRSPSPTRRRSPLPMRCRSPLPMRCRSPSPVHRRSTSSRHRSLTPVRHRPPSSVRHRSPTPSSGSPSAMRHGSPSPVRCRSPLPMRRRSPSPIRRGSPLPLRRRSPSPMRRRSHSPMRRRQQRSPSMPRHRSPFPVRRRSPLLSHRRSPTSSPHGSPSVYESSSPSPPRRLPSLDRKRSLKDRRSPMQSPGERISSLRSPQRRPQYRKDLHTKESDLSPSPLKSPIIAESPMLMRKRSPNEHRRSFGPYESPPRRTRERMMDNVGLSPRQKTKEQKARPVSPEMRKEEKQNNLAWEDEDHKSKSSHRRSQLSSSVNKQKDEETKSEKQLGRRAHPETPNQRSPTLRGDKQRTSHLGEGEKSDGRNHSHSGSIKERDGSHKLDSVPVSVGKIDNNNQSATFDSDSEVSGKHRSEVREKRKHRRSERREAASDDDYSYDSEIEGRKEAKRRRKEEKKLRKEEKRWRREERRRKREEKRAEKLKVKNQYDTSGSDDEHALMKESNQGNDEEAESEQKKLEIELRQKALESLKAKKGIGY